MDDSPDSPVDTFNEGLSDTFVEVVEELIPPVYEIVADYVEITRGILKSLARRVRRVGRHILEQSGEEASG